jgi:hypothetical protein
MANFVDKLAAELEARGALDQVNGWLARGDGVAVYEARAMDRSDFGNLKFVSFGSTAAQLETNDPPQRLPDIGNEINWQFQLVGTHRGSILKVPGHE